MKAVARLVWSYFMGTLMNRAFTIGGLVLIGLSLYILTTQPKAGEMVWLGMFGIFAFFFGSSLLPVMFGRLSRSHSTGVLPHGRLKLLVSVFVTTIVVSIPAAILAPAAVVAGNGARLTEAVRHPQHLTFILELAGVTFTSAMLFTVWLYLAIWFMSNQRNMMGFAKALLVIVVIVFAPARDIRELSLSLTWNLQQIAVIWIVFGAGFLFWPRYKAVLARRSRRRFTGSALTRGVIGREFDLMLGTSNPWRWVAALAVPTLIATRFEVDGSAAWLYFLTIFSTVVGAIAGEAAGRSRALWLRGDWSRERLFAQVEHAFWRHNGCVLGVLMLLMVAVGGYVEIPARTLAAGLPLLVLGTVLSTYLGLLVTQGLRWIECALGVMVMVALMVLAWVIAEDEAELTAVYLLEAMLAMLALVLRFAARRRWTRIDWMLSRPNRALVARGA